MDDQDPKALRDHLAQVALEWQRRYGVAPAITSSISEYDAAMLVGLSDAEYRTACYMQTAVTKGVDFSHNGVRYQIKANRPSGRPGSRVTLVGKARNYDWDILIWVLYDTKYQIQEAWQWERQEYIRHFDSKKRLSPADMRKGTSLVGHK